MRLDAETIEGFVGSILLKRFDEPVAIPEFHREIWKLCCSRNPFVAIASPRGFGKSTAITHSYVLACVLFRERSFVLLISSTEAQSILFLNDLKNELKDNTNLQILFGVPKFLKDAETDFIVEMPDGHRFRIMAKGAEQQLRGAKWASKRPDCIICHQSNTPIYTPETGWIKNQDHPTANLIHAHEAYELEFENGTKEVVSGDHRYLTDRGWKFIWQLQNNENVIESVNADIVKNIQNDANNLNKNIIVLQKLKNLVDAGLQQILIWILIQKKPGMSVIKNKFILGLEILLKSILRGRQRLAR